ncbi:MAG: hypothetical protein AMXMBFR59_22800 [Rhodanobacteraceae bacterium]
MLRLHSEVDVTAALRAVIEQFVGIQAQDQTGGMGVSHELPLLREGLHHDGSCRSVQPFRLAAARRAMA